MRYPRLTNDDRVSISVYLISLIDSGNEDMPEMIEDIKRLSDKIIGLKKIKCSGCKGTVEKNPDKDCYAHYEYYCPKCDTYLLARQVTEWKLIHI